MTVGNRTGRAGFGGGTAPAMTVGMTRAFLCLLLLAGCALDEAVPETETEFTAGGGIRTLELVGSGYGGLPVTTRPERLSCNGGGGPGCSASFPVGSRVEIHYPQIIQAQGRSLVFDSYYCEGDQTTTASGGAPDRTVQTIFLYENFRCTAYYF